MNYLPLLRVQYVLLTCISFVLASNPVKAQTPCSPVPDWVESTSVDPGTELTACKPWAIISVSVIYTNEPCADSQINEWVVGDYTFSLNTNTGVWTKTGFNDSYDFALDDSGGTGILTRSPDAKPTDVKVHVGGIKEWWIHTCPVDNPTYGSSKIDINVHFTIDKDGQSCSSQCSGPGGGSPGGPPGHWPGFGTSSIQNDRGPNINFPLGDFSLSQSAGSLVLNARASTAQLSTPNALSAMFLPDSTNGVDIVTNASGVIQQVRPPQGLVNVVTVNSSKYLLQMFYNSAVTPKSGGYYGTNASAFDVWTVDGTAGTNQLIITESPSGSASRSFTYQYTNISGVNMWQLTDSGGLRTVRSWQSNNSTNSQMYTVYNQVLSGGNIVQMKQSMYTNVSGNLQVIQVEGTGSTTNITLYSYNSLNQLQEIDYPDGHWSYYERDSLGKVTTEYSTYLNSPSPAASGSYPNPTTCKMATYSYSAVASDDPGKYRLDLPRTETTYLPAFGSYTQVSVKYRSAPSPDEVEEWDCPLPTAWYSDTGNLLSTTVYFTDPADPNTFGRICWQVLPDGTAKLYSYQDDASGTLTNIVMQNGQPDSTVNPGLILNGVQTGTALNSLGKVLAVTNQVIVNGSITNVVAGWAYTYLDALQLSCNVVDLAGRTNQYQYACCGISSKTDADGVVSIYDYDSLRRQVAQTTIWGGSVGVKETNILDAVGQILSHQRIGTDGSVITLRQYGYDVLGRTSFETNALGGFIVHTNLMAGNQLCRTNTNPDGGTSIEVYFADGRPQIVCGTAVAPMQYSYGVENDSDGSAREYTLTTKLASDGGTNEWEKVYVDGIGRAYKTIYAGSGSNPYAVSYYDFNGHLTNSIDADGVSTLYAYNQKGERTLSVVDLTQSGLIDYGGTNRITFTTNDVVTDHGTVVNRTRVYAWSTNSVSLSNLIWTVETSVDSLKRWKTVWVNGNAVTAQTVTTYIGDGNRYTTNIAPDSSYTVEAYSYGRQASNTRFDSSGSQLSATSYTYDAHGRENLVTDARNGTTTNFFNAADEICGTGTPAPASGQSSQVISNCYDTSLRLWKTVYPDGTSLTNKYSATGALTNQSGSRVYPVAYTFDAQGRIKTMTTWTNYASAQGASTTTWNYDTFRGWPTNKAYADSMGPVYTYTAAGRLACRIWARGVGTTNSYNTAGDLGAVNYSDSTPTLRFTYDRRGHQIGLVQGSATTTRSYDESGNLLGEAYGGGTLNGFFVTNQFDQFLRRTNASAWNGTSTRFVNAVYTFDQGGRLHSASDGTNSATYVYLANSPLVSQVLFTNGTAQRMSTTFQFDFLNRFTSISNIPSSAAAMVFNYGYNSANQRTAVTNVDGSRWAWGYDPLGQVSSGNKYWSDGSYVAGQQFQYSFDDIGNRRSASAGGDVSGLNLRTQNYTANNLSEYTSRTVPGYAQVVGTAATNSTVTLWTSGNAYAGTSRKGNYFRGELAVNNSGTPLWLSITNFGDIPGTTSADVLTNQTGNVYLPRTPESFSYDLDGNLTNDGRWTYTWDAENRLIQMVANNFYAPQQLIKFEYDGRGRRIHKQVWNNINGSGTAAVDQRFLYDEWNIVAEVNISAAPLRTYIWGLDLSGSLRGAGGIGGLLEISYYGSSLTNCFAAFDGNGNVACLVGSSTGALAAQYEYGPFGEVIRATGLMAKANPLRFSTKYQDDESDLLYFGYRYYSATLGKWCGRDSFLANLSLSRESRAQVYPIDVNPLVGPNLYAFVRNDPISDYDILGLRPPLPGDPGYHRPRPPAPEPPEPQEPPTYVGPVMPLTAPWHICCRPVRGHEHWTHCDLRQGPCDPDTGSREYPVWRDVKCCKVKSDLEMSKCFKKNYTTAGGGTCGGYGDNCETTTIDALRTCCGVSSWKPDWYAAPLPGNSPYWPPLVN